MTAESITVWAFDGTTLAGGMILNDTGGSWRLAGSGSDGAGNFQVQWQDGSGEVTTWQANETALSANAGFGNWGGDWSVAGTGDYAGDGTIGLQWLGAAGQAALWLTPASMPNLKIVVDTDPATAWHLQAN